MKVQWGKRASRVYLDKLDLLGTMWKCLWYHSTL